MCKRLFVGIEARQQALFESAMALGEQLPGRYHPLANYHVTLAFIGAYAQGPVQQALERLPCRGPLWLETLPVPGFFKEGKKAVLYAPVKPSDPLGLLAYGVGKCLKEAKIPFDDRETYTPHVTLARGVDSAAYGGQILCQVQWEAADFCLYESVSGETGLTYQVLKRFKI
ncbi:MAG: RNA 2',3'-cyclic phosphodiesterase [Clostridia bacterium]|nr:RNA 2',3'-cyclic phosphodiesterase [Clostridia bacterium]